MPKPTDEGACPGIEESMDGSAARFDHHVTMHSWRGEETSGPGGDPRDRKYVPEWR